MVLGAFAAGIVVVVLAVLIFGGGGDGNGGSGIGGGAASGDGLGPGIGLGEFPEPVPVDLPEEVALFGPNNEEAAAAVETLLSSVGVNVAALDIYVFPIADVGESLLVIDGELDSLTTSQDEADLDEATFVSLAELPELKAANVRRVAMNLRGEDEQGPYVLTLTMPLSLLENPDSTENMTEQELLEAFKVQVSRENP